MEKLITLRYAAKCKKCGKVIDAGSSAVWLGQKLGVQHQACTAHSEPATPKEKPKEQRVYTRDYSDVRADFQRWITSPETYYKHEHNRNGRAMHLRESHNDVHWCGCSINEMQDWIKNGYRVEGMGDITSLVPAKPRRKLIYGEEGDELLIDLAWSGSDEPFVSWEKRRSTPGLSVEIYMTFSSMYPARTIMQYQRWVARALQTLDENGIDMEVNLVIPAMNSDISHGAEKVTENRIRVRKAGEASDFANWSAMFSPGGFRMLGILTIGTSVDSIGGVIASGYGRPLDYGKWEVAHDPERNVVVIGNDNDYFNHEFPEREMTDKLVSVLAKLNG